MKHVLFSVSAKLTWKKKMSEFSDFTSEITCPLFHRRPHRPGLASASPRESDKTRLLRALRITRFKGIIEAVAFSDPGPFLSTVDGCCPAPHPLHHPLTRWRWDGDVCDCHGINVNLRVSASQTPTLLDYLWLHVLLSSPLTNRGGW